VSASPLVTVVTTTYHWPAALRVAMTSALAQTFRDFEYLVVGDACTDDTESVVASFGDPRVRWHNLPQNCGNQSGPNRVAVEMARGKYVAYLNHDDVWLPHHLQSLVQRIATDDYDLVHSLCLDVGPPGSGYRGVLGLPFVHPRGAEHGTLVHTMTSTMIHPTATALAVGNWSDWRELDELPTVDFIRRLERWRGRHDTVKSVTVLKFNSADRRDSYRRQSAAEQEAYWAQVREGGPAFLIRELLGAIECQLLQASPPKLPQEERPAAAPPGWQINQWRKMRGLEPIPTSAAAPEPRR
jgi:glycosyltransferase involved in cell wall biosynthesis